MRGNGAHVVVARHFVDVCELVIVDPAVLDVFDGSVAGRIASAPLVIENAFHARAVLWEPGRRSRSGQVHKRFVLEIDALDRGPHPRTELRLFAVARRRWLRRFWWGGPRRLGTLVHTSLQEIVGRMEMAQGCDTRREPRQRDLERWVEELSDQQHNAGG